MKKIAIFQDDLNIGGIQKSLINLLNNLDYSEYSVDLFVFQSDGVWRDRIPEEVTVKILKPMKESLKFIPFDVALSAADYSFEDISENYDLAVDFNSYQPWTAVCAISIPANKRVMWVHNDIKIKYKEEWKYRVLFNAMKGKYKYFEEFACVSDAIIQPFIELTGQNDKEYFTIPNYVDADEILNKSHQSVDDAKFDEKCFNICAVGRLCHQKGFDIMIDTFAKAVNERDDLRLYIIGEGEEQSSIVKQIERLNMQKYISVLGRKENPYAYMNRCDAFISTSRYEGQGINILEAKVLGLQIFIPKHLEKYVEGINGSVDIVQDLICAEKKDKNIDYLSEYNAKTLAMFGILC